MEFLGVNFIPTKHATVGPLAGVELVTLPMHLTLVSR
jgi:hypothetical protein